MDKFTLIKDQAFDEGQLLATARDKGDDWQKAEKRRQKEEDAEARRKFRYAIYLDKHASQIARFYGLHARGYVTPGKKRPGPPKNNYREWIDLIKTAAVCTDCGKDWEPVALGFDHLPERGAKSFSISQGSNKSIEELVIEMAKCEIVCHACHAIRTNNRIKAKKQAAYLSNHTLN